MNIALLLGSLAMGGAERQLITLANELSSLGHNVTLFVLRRIDSDQMKSLVDDRVSIIEIGRINKFDFWFSVKLVKEIRRLRPDILHSYLDSSNIITALLKPFLTTKVVWGIRSARAVPDRLDRLGKVRIFFMFRLSGIPDLYISNSMAGKQIRVSKGVSPGKIVVVPNGIDTDFFHVAPEEGRVFRETIGVGNSELVVGIVASIRPVKDHSTFLKMAKHLTEENMNCRFVVVGTGNSGFEGALRQQSENLGISDRVLWLGHHRDLRPIYNGLDVLVSSSLAEGFSNVVAEAMACGTPTVVTDAGDSANIVVHKQLVAEIGNWRQLATSVRWALDAQNSHILAPQSLRDSIVQRFSMDALGKRTENLFYKLLSSSEGPTE